TLSCVFLYTSHPPPSHTPFPYTTPFRSLPPDGIRVARTGPSLPTQFVHLLWLRLRHGIHTPVTMMSRGIYRLLNVRTAPLLMRRSEEHTSELQSRENIVCRLQLEIKHIA